MLLPPLPRRYPDTPQFDIRYDLYGRSEPRVEIFKPGTRDVEEVVPLSEAECRGIVPKERADRSRENIQRIREAWAKMQKEAKVGGQTR